MTRAATALAAALAAIALAACGDEGEPIPARQADRLTTLLDVAQGQAEAGSCGTLLEDTIPSLERRAAALPEEVSSDTRETIEDGIAHLRGLAEDDCAQKQEEELPTTSETTTPETTTPETTAPETTTTDETTTQETTTEPPTTDTQQTTPTEPPPTNGTGGTPPGQGGTPPGQERKDAGKQDGGDG